MGYDANMKLISVLSSLLASYNLTAGELKITIDPVLKPIPSSSNTNLFRWITVHYTGPATNNWSYQLIPSETMNGPAYVDLGTDVSFSKDHDWKNIRWIIDPNSKPTAFFRVVLISEN